MLLEEPYINFLIKHNLTQSQFLMLYLIHKNRADLMQKYAEKFPTDDNTLIGEYLIQDLINKEFIIEEGGKYKIGNKFKEIFVDRWIATEEIYTIYPKYFHKTGIDYPLEIMDRGVFSRIYDEAILSSVEEHEKIKQDIQYGIKHNLINISLEKFVKSQYWKSLRSHRIQHIEPQLHEPEF